VRPGGLGLFEPFESFCGLAERVVCEGGFECKSFVIALDKAGAHRFFKEPQLFSPVVARLGQLELDKAPAGLIYRTAAIL
jgi:hypothetical protein